MIQFKILILLTFAGAALSSDYFDRRPFARIGGKFYWIEGIAKVNWFQAAHSCRSLGGHLASIENSQEMNAISNNLIQRSYTRNDWFWVSGNDLGQEGQFYWLRTGKRFTYSRWSSNQPDNDKGNEDCVHLWIQGNGSFFMNDRICSYQAYYICQADEYQVVPVITS